MAFYTLNNCCSRSCQSCAASSICSMCGYGHVRCNLIPIVSTTAVTYATAETDLAIPALSLPTDRFILDVAQLLTATNTLPVDLDEDTVTTVIPLFDRHGNYVRTDSLANTIIARKQRRLPWVESSATRFRAVLGSDPVRVNILDCLVPTSYVAPTTTTGD